MKIELIYVPCSVCGSEKCTEVYTSVQNVSDVIKEVTVDVVMCDNCHFLFNNPRPTESILNEHYQTNSSGDVYKRIDSNSRGERLTSLRLSFVEQYLSQKQSGKILDVGCGNGHFLDSINLLNWSKTGIDLSPSAGKNISDKNIDIIITNVLDFNPIEKFDLITCFSSFEHFYAPEITIKKIHSLLVPHGVLIVNVPNSSYPISGLEEYYCLEHLSHFTKDTFEMLCNKNKFKVLNYNEQNQKSHSILCSARADNDVEFKLLGNVKKIRKTIENYNKETTVLKDKILTILDENISQIKLKSKKIAVYGAGFHNYFLFKLFEFENCIECFIDSDPNKWGNDFMGKVIKSPNEISTLDVDTILISSHYFELEIANTISEYNSQNIPVVKLYN